MNGKYDAPMSNREVAEALRDVAAERRRVISIARQQKKDKRTLIAITIVAAGIVATIIGVGEYLSYRDSPLHVTFESFSNSRDPGPGWFNPRYEGWMDSVLEAQPQWQLVPYGKFYRERDLMGRRT